MAQLLVLDACVLLNLLASGHFSAIARGAGFQFAITEAVSKEAIYLRSAVLEDQERERIVLRPMVDDALLQILRLETEETKLRYLELALELDDGEASSIAVAESERVPLATDDKKARRLIQDRDVQILLWSTIGLLKQWQRVSHVDSATMRSVVVNVSTRARFRPGADQRDLTWWNSFFASPGH